MKNGRQQTGKKRAGLAAMELALALPVRGADVLALGVPAGPRVGKLMAAIAAWWEEGDYRADRAACLRKLKQLLSAK